MKTRYVQIVFLWLAFALSAAAQSWVIYLSGTNFSSTSSFQAQWNYLYPWGSDHNGSARMFATNVNVAGGVVTLTSYPTSGEGASSVYPYLTIDYNSGTIYAKQPVTVNAEFPFWEVSGYFQCSSTTGTWPAFWLTGAWGWPPESDIMEYKGSSGCNQNTYTGAWQGQITTVSLPGNWHSYQAWLTQVNATDVDIYYYIDGSLISIQRGTNFVNQPMWLIMDYQMEGSSGSPGPNYVTTMSGSNIVVAAQSAGLSGTIIGTPGSYNSSGNTNGLLFDGNLGTFFDGPDPSGDWAGLDQGAGVSNIITEIVYAPRPGWAWRMVGGVFQGANQPNFSDAVTLAKITVLPPDSIATGQAITNSTSFRYLRYVGPNNGYCNAAEISFIGHAQNFLSGTVIGTSGSFANRPQTMKAAVFDGNAGTFFDGPDASGDWAGLDFGTNISMVISAVGYAPRGGWESRMTGGTFQGANKPDFSDAITLATVPSTPTDGQLTRLAVNNSNTFRYVRYLSPANGYCNVAELQFFGVNGPNSFPLPPLNLNATSDNVADVLLNWTGSVSATSYNIRRSTNNGLAYTFIGTSSTTTFIDTNTVSGTSYYYVVSALNSNGESSNSSPAVVRPCYAASSAACLSFMLSNNPVAYWRLNETNGSTTALDSVGGHNATYGGVVLAGVAGPQPPDFLGFELTNTAAQFVGNATNSWITIPALNLNTNTVTFTAWIYPIGSQAAYAGLVFCRSGSTAAGMNYDGAGANLGYTWNGDSGSWGWNSGVQPPANQWSFAAVVVKPMNAVVYLINTNGSQSATNVLTQPIQAFAGTGTIGTDTYASTARVFNGLLDEVAVFNYALSPAQIQQIYNNGHQLPQVQVGLQAAGAGLNLNWPQGTLFQATNLSGPWSAVTNAASPFAVTPTNAAGFFRVLLR